MRNRWVYAVILSAFLGVPGLRADSRPFTEAPKSLSELRLLQAKVQEVYRKVLPAVVGVQIGSSAGSGVVVSEDGYVLTAGHVSGKPNEECRIIFPDGKVAKGRTLGSNKQIDSGMLKITDDGKWPHVSMGDSTDLVKGQWVLSLGHPGGFIQGRTPVLRVGRIQNFTDNIIVTDCPLVGGDSGGPLFDLDGKVIGIHSRIGPSIAFNVHVPIKTFQETWDRLVAGETWGNGLGIPNRTPPREIDLGLRYELVGGVLKVAEVRPGSIAEKAGLRARDLIVSLDGKSVATADDIREILSKKNRGDSVTIEVDRGAERMSLKLSLNP
ncbi:MAG: S1C family serine protease [Gemmataceae bacterium]|nr:S1C family serine protease [Gemmataceae bacterium]